MNIARILYPVEVLGPGKRIGIWFCGCSHSCKGCSNPELWNTKPEYEISVASFIALLRKAFSSAEVDGFVLTGGDPFYQADELNLLLGYLHEWNRDILVYTGFTYLELHEMEDASIKQCLAKIGVLIDGRYIESKNDGVPLRGSSNQNIIYLQPDLKEKYEVYMTQMKNPIQNFTVQGGIISVGIHKAGFSSELRGKAAERGVVMVDD